MTCRAVLCLTLLMVLGVTSRVLADPGTTWETKVPDPDRFVRLSAFNDAAVFDNETGRVWEQAPRTTRQTWSDALAQCYRLELGGRKGWRLPTIEELASLVDIARADSALPAGHPFDNVQLNFYWSATSSSNVSNAWRVLFADGEVTTVDKRSLSFVWCVRGGQGIAGPASGVALPSD